MNIEQANIKQNSFIQNGGNRYFSRALKISAAFFLYALFVALSALAANAATFTVTNVNDSGAGSLRQAILSVNAAPNASHTINFSIGTGLKTINLTSALPPVATFQNVTIDGTTQGGFANVPLIEINGASAGGSANGLNFSNSSGDMGDVIVKSLIINRFAGSGIRASNVKSLSVYGSYIGTDANGSTDLGNGFSGIYLSPGDNANVSNIGGTGANERNVIAGNNGAGVTIYGLYTADIKIVNNYIGVNASAVIDVGNSGSGVEIADFSGASKVTIGGTTAAERNVISGNNQNGISIGLHESVTILGNYIGLGANGTTALGNTKDGVHYSLNGEVADGVTIGGANGAGNTISANGGDGIEVGYYDQLGLGTISPVIVGNRIGTDYNGAIDRGNGANGILVTGSALPAIGRETAGEGNTISGNGANGIYFAGGGGTVRGNRIGTTSLGAALSNTGAGIFVSSSYGLQIGKENSAAVNVISGNGSHGVQLGGSAQNFKIVNNLIGINTLNQAIPNGGSGVFITDSADAGQIGGTAVGSGNTIAYNLGDGIGMKANPAFQNPPVDVSFVGNSIYQNGNLGIDLEDNGISINDPGDADTGVNNLQNYPEIQGASPAQINGTLNSTANQSFRLDFYRVDTCDAGGHGEGRYYLGSTDATTDANGNATFLATGVALATGQFITATATQKSSVNTLLSTSEFSPCQTVSQPPGNLALSAASYAVNESSNTATITVNRTNGTIGTIGVAYSTSNGTANAGQDYAATSGTLTFQTGETTKTFTIPITDDQSDEPAETVNIALSNPTGGAAIVAPSSAVLTINDNDAPPQISANTVSLAEGNEGTTAFNFSVTLSQPSAFPVSVNYQTANGTANASVDYTATNGTLNFAANETSKQVTVQVRGDTTPEIDEAFELTLSNPTNATIGGSGIGQILDDDNPGKLQFSQTNYSVSENASLATITVTRTNGTAGTISVNYSTQNGTATAGADYQTASGTLTFLDGQPSATFNIPIVQDDAGEGGETVLIALSNVLGGAGFGSPTNAVLTITDDDGGLPANVAISGKISKNNAPLPNVLMTLSGSQSATVLTDANGDFNFANLAAGGNYLVTPTANGHVFEPASLSFANLQANAVNANFTASTGTTPRKVRIAAGGVDVVPGNSVVVPIEIFAQGNENSIGFSLNYDANLLGNAQATLGADAAAATLVVNNANSGKIGVLISMPAGQTFPAGTRRVVNVSFLSAQTNLFSTLLTFGNQPVGKEIADQNADVLPVVWEDGVLMFAQGFESDVAPRPTGSGNGTVSVADLTQLGKFIAGVDAMNPNYNEFQRADAAPKGTKGNGVLSVSDYTQAGRYAAGLDAVQTAGGASAEALLRFNSQGKLTAENSVAAEAKAARKKTSNNALGNFTDAARVVRVVNATATPGQAVVVSVETDAQGDENGYGFTLNYDSAGLSAPIVTLGTGATGATLFANTQAAGKVGVVMAMPAGQIVEAGTKQLVTVRFNVAPNAGGGQIPLVFADSPVVREVVNANADVLPTTFADGAVILLAPTAANVTVGGKVTDAAGRGIPNATVSMTDQAGQTRMARTNPFGFYRFDEVAAGATYVFSASSKTHSFAAQMQAIFEDTGEINFVAQQ